jgi:hypothetical protein
MNLFDNDRYILTQTRQLLWDFNTVFAFSFKGVLLFFPVAS